WRYSQAHEIAAADRFEGGDRRGQGRRQNPPRALAGFRVDRVFEQRAQGALGFSHRSGGRGDFAIDRRAESGLPRRERQRAHRGHQSRADLSLPRRRAALAAPGGRLLVHRFRAQAPARRDRSLQMVLQPVRREGLRDFGGSRRLSRRSGGPGLPEIFQRRESPHVQKMRHRGARAEMKASKPAGALRRRIDRLMRLAGDFRRAEAAVVRAFFAQPKPARAHVGWLQAQGFKEYSAIKPILAALAACHPDIDRGIDRHAYAELTEKLADETRHARLVMDLLEEICGKKITPRDLTWLAEDRKLARARAKYSKSYAGLLHGSQKITVREIKRRDEALERAAITLTEGGGGALYQVCRGLRRNA